MFQELMPLLAQRILLLTLSRVSDEQICVNVIPKSLKSDQQNDDAALTTPLSVTGAPKELDEQLPRQLVEFVETHLGLSSTLNSAKEQMEAAAKAAREAARKPTNSKPHSGSSRSATPSPAQVQTEAGTKESSDDSQSSPEPSEASVIADGPADLGPSTGNLFDVGTSSTVR
jgi:PRTRC genetic system protein E